MRALLSFIFVWSTGIFAQGATEFKFEDDPSAVLNSVKLTLPPKTGSILSLPSSVSTEGNMGAVSYTYTIKLAPWRNLFSDLKLVYENTSGLSSTGQGFQFQIPHISRQSSQGVPDSNSNLVSSNDGELVAIGNRFLRARAEKNYRLYKREADSLRVYEGDGRIYVYGLDAASQERSDAYIYRWWLSEIQDPAGYKVRFVYRKFRGQGSSLDKILFIDGIHTGSPSVTYAFEVNYRESNYQRDSWRNGLQSFYSHIVTNVSGYWTAGQIGEDQALQTAIGPGRADSRIFSVNFEYENSTADQRPLLKKIERFGRTNNPADRDITPTLSYSPSCPGPGCTTAVAINRSYVVPGDSALTSATARWMDLNGDGLADLVSRDDDLRWSAHLNTSHATNDDTLQFAEPRRTIFPFRDIESPQHAIIDVNGDRRVDLLVQDATEGTVEAYVNQVNEEGFWNKTPVPVKGLPQRATIGDPSLGVWIDLNADSKTDFIQYVDDGEMTFYVFLNSSNDKDLAFEFIGELKTPSRLRVSSSLLLWTDMNGDQLPDLVQFMASTDEGQQQLFVYENDGHFGVLAPIGVTLAGYRGLIKPRFSDINGDGLPDAIVGSEAVPIMIFLNNSTANWPIVNGSIDTSELGAVTAFDIGDINGNGSSDFIISTVGRNIHVYDPYLNQRVKAPHALESARLDNGVEEKFYYQSSAKGDQYRPDSLPTTMQVLRRYERLAASFLPSGQFKFRLVKALDLNFTLPSYNYRDNEFAGFKNVTTTEYQDLDSIPGPTRGRRAVSTYYTSEDEFYLKGNIHTREEFGLKSGRRYAMETHEYGSRSLFRDLPIRAVYLKSQETIRFEGAQSQKVTNTYCTQMKSPQMIPAQKTETRFLNDRPVSTIVSMFPFGEEYWFFKKAQRLILIEPGKDADQNKTLLDKKMKYNTAICKLSKVEVLNESGAYITKSQLTYDEFGNIAEMTDARGYHATFEYEEPGHYQTTRFRYQVNDDFSLEKQATYDYLARGELASTTDENQGKAVFSYDGLGRISSWRSPLNEDGEPDFRYEYEWGNDSKPTTVRTFASGVTRPSVTLLDGSLKLAAEAQPSRGGYFLKKFEAVDGFGLPIAVSKRAFVEDINRLPLALSPEFLSIQEFDEQGRLLKGDHPAAQGKRSLITMDYRIEGDFMVTGSLNSANERYQTYRDGLDRTRKHVAGKTAPRTITFEYDAASRIRSIAGLDDGSRTYTWGLNGKIKAIHGDSLGVYAYEYDGNDLMISRMIQDAQGQAFESRYYVYDGQSRLLQERLLRGAALPYDQGFEKASINFLMTYDQTTSTNGMQQNLVGQLASLRVFPGATYHYSYDKNQQKIGEFLDFYNKQWSMTYRYDEQGRLLHITYPDQVSYDMTYSAEDGLMASMSSVANVIEYDGFKQLVSIENDRLKETRTFDPGTGFMLSKDFAGTGATMHRSYTPDIMGRLQSLSGSDEIFGSITRSYTYDDIGRLKTSKLGYSSPKGSDSPLNASSQYGYDPQGNLISNELGPLEITSTTGLTQIKRTIDPAQTWQFDSIGRMVSAPQGRQIIWASSDRVACFVNGQGPQVRMEFMPDGSRFTEVSKDETGTHSRLYFNKYAHYDKEKDQWTRLLYVEQSPFMAVIGTEAAQNFRDLVGTTDAEVGSQKLNAYSVHYPFGATVWEQNAKGWVGPYRYAGSLRQPSFEFDQMKTRFYDARLGRFISADRYLWEQPGSCSEALLGCDLYVYGRNNPNTFVDPNGQNPLVIAGAIIGGGMAGIGAYMERSTAAMAAGKQMTGADWGAVAVAAGSGAVKGAIMGAMPLSGATAAFQIANGAGVALLGLTNLAEKGVTAAIDIGKNPGVKIDPVNFAVNVGAKAAVATGLDLASGPGVGKFVLEPLGLGAAGAAKAGMSSAGGYATELVPAALSEGANSVVGNAIDGAAPVQPQPEGKKP